MPCPMVGFNGSGLVSRSRGPGAGVRGPQMVEFVGSGLVSRSSAAGQGPWPSRCFGVLGLAGFAVSAPECWRSRQVRLVAVHPRTDDHRGPVPPVPATWILSGPRGPAAPATLRSGPPRRPWRRLRRRRKRQGERDPRGPARSPIAKARRLRASITAATATLTMRRGFLMAGSASVPRLTLCIPQIGLEK